MEDILGKKFGKWTILEFVGRDLKSNQIYRCRCECGFEKDQRKGAITNGDSLSCKKCRMVIQNKQVDISGQTINGAYIMRRIENQNDNAQYLIICACGREKRALLYKLQAGLCTKCPHCRVKTHGCTNTRTFKIWRGMISRCNNIRTASYKYYGGKGIRVCDRWKSFEYFVEDMGMCPPNLTIDRINPLGNYEPGNCQWITKSENSSRMNESRRKT